MRFMLRNVCLATCCLLAIPCLAQQSSPKGSEETKLADPFQKWRKYNADRTPENESMSGHVAGMGIDMYLGMAVPQSEDEVFADSLRKALKMLKASSDDANAKKQILGYIQNSLQQRYAKMLQKREDRLKQVESQVAELKKELALRKQAQDRVIAVQLSSLELVAEGVIRLEDIQNLTGSSKSGAEMGMEYGSP